MKQILAALLFSLGACAAAPALAAGTDETPTARPAVNDLEEGRKAVKAKQWRVAIDHLEKAAAKDRNNADIFNWLGYSYRNSGNIAKGMEAYNVALKLNPNHRGANEYIGVAYLLQKNKPKAQEHLARLETICGKSCEEYEDLQKAIAAYKE
jgi:Flp pilus assembly protein TadD